MDLSQSTQTQSAHDPQRCIPTVEKAILTENDLPDLRFHDLRHTFATYALANGVDAKTLAGILGHTKASFTVDTYTHTTTDMHRKAPQNRRRLPDGLPGRGDGSMAKAQKPR